MGEILLGDRVALPLLGDGDGVEDESTTNFPLNFFSLSSAFLAKNNFKSVVSASFGFIPFFWLGFCFGLVTALVLFLTSGLVLRFKSWVFSWFGSGLVSVGGLGSHSLGWSWFASSSVVVFDGFGFPL